MQGYREMAGVSKIDDFLRSSDFLTGHSDYEYGSNVKNTVGCGWSMSHMLYKTRLKRFYR